MNNNIKIVSWNARSIHTKKEELFNFLVNRNVDICLICETWLNKKSSVRHNSFYCYRFDRQNGTGGGVAILIKKNIHHQLIPPKATEIIENVGVRVSCGNEFIDIYSCYFPGGNIGSDSSKLLKFKSDLRKLINTSNKYIFGGDLNCRHSYWGCLRNNTWGNILYDKVQLNETQIAFPHEYTYIPADPNKQPSTLDFFLTNVLSNMSAVKVINDLASDHLPIMTNVNLTYKSVDNVVYAFNRANWPRFTKLVKRNLPTLGDYSEITNSNQIDDMINIFNTVIKTAIDNAVPKKPTKKHQRPKHCPII